MGEKIVGEVYKGPCGILKDSDWLTAETLPTDRDTVLQIESVHRFTNLKLGGGQRQDVKRSAGALKFAGRERMLLLNSTNLKVMSALFGADTGKWFGQHIALHVERVSAFGQQVDAIRIRPQRIKAPPAAKVEANGDAPREPGSD